MNQENTKCWKKYLPHALIILFFAILAYAFTPQVFEGKVVNQADISSWRGMSNEIVEYNKENPDDPTYWTNSMFSGMPAIPISVIYEGDLIEPLYKLLFIGERPASYLLISLVGAFLMFLAFGVNWKWSALGAVAVSFCSYNMQIIQVGHNSKMVAIALMPWVLAGVAYAYRKKALLGAVLFAFALSFQIKANHPQITYYLAMIVVAFGISELVYAVKDKALPKFLKTSALLLVCGLLGIATNINHLWPTYEYAKYTMRGGSELTTEGSNDSGLDLDYATAWSYGPEELPNLFIPNFNGGASAGALTTDSETYKTLSQLGQPGAREIIQQLPLYWGPQPFTAGPMYMGAVSMFLCILGLFLYKGRNRWWMFAISIIAILLAFGSHLMFFSKLFFDFAPLYSKFRTVSMILVILQITIPLTGILTLDQLSRGDYDAKKFKAGFITALSICGGFALIMALAPSFAGDFVSSSDGQLPDVLVQSLREDRASLLTSDAWRSFSFVIASALVIYIIWKKYLKTEYAAIILMLLMIFDLWTVDKRYLNDSHFMNEKQFENQFALRGVDQLILQDKDPDYRVLDLSVNTFNDAHTSYHHKTIGGYSPAKLQRYQDIIDYFISGEIGRLSQDISGAATVQDAQNAMQYYPVLSMLNTKYVILDGNLPPLTNPYQLGNAWFVNDIRTASSANEEIATLGAIDPAAQAVMAKEFAEKVSLPAQTDSSAIINLTEYRPNRLTYHYTSGTGNLAVFSEVYYPKGWRATIDGEETDILRADYILRAIQVPAGTHVIEFYFQPESIVKGAHLSRISSGILLFILLAIAGIEIRRYVGRQNGML